MEFWREAAGKRDRIEENEDKKGGRGKKKAGSESVRRIGNQVSIWRPKKPEMV